MEKVLVGAFSMIVKLREGSFEALNFYYYLSNFYTLKICIFASFA